MPPAESAAVGARASAARVVARVLVEARFLDTALADWRQQRTDEAGEPALVQELSYGVMRWYHQLAGIASLFLSRPLKPKDMDVHALLLVGLYQLRHTRVADHAAVDATVAAAEVLRKPWAKGLLNACLRSSLRETERVERAIAKSDEMRYSHPAWLIAAVRRDRPDAWESILEANNKRPPMTLRVNTARIRRAGYAALLQQEGIDASAHFASEGALVLQEPVPVEQLPGFEDGLVSVQDAAAQLAAAWLAVEPSQRVLDACAAPGGKAAHILERYPALAELTALDVDPQRLERVRANFSRLRLGGHIVTGDASDPRHWWDGTPYERILVDAPCSATGVIRRHPDIKWRRQTTDLARLVQTQARILDGVWPCLARGGKLLYATCSVLCEENELQRRDFLARHADAAAEPLGVGADETQRQILPGENGMDGFYYASIRKL